MPLLISMAIIMIVGLALSGYHRLLEVERQDDDGIEVAHVLIELQNAVLRWEVEAGGIDGVFTLPNAADFVTDQLGGVDSYGTPMTATSTTSEVTVTMSRIKHVVMQMTMTGVEHPLGDVAGLLWRPEAVEIHLFGDYTDRTLSRARTLLPQAALVSRGATTTTAFWNRKPLHAVVTPDDDIFETSIGMVVPHPLTFAGVQQTIARRAESGIHTQVVLDSPLVFDDAAHGTAQDPCGGLPAMTVDSDGVPLFCIAMQDDHNVRVWQPMEAPTSAYCRDTALGRNDPKYEHPVPNMVVVWGSVDQAHGKALGVPIPATIVDDAPVCPREYEQYPTNRFFCMPSG